MMRFVCFCHDLLEIVLIADFKISQGLVDDSTTEQFQLRRAMEKGEENDDMEPKVSIFSLNFKRTTP